MFIRLSRKLDEFDERITKSLGELKASFSKGLETIKKKKCLNSFTKTKNTETKNSGNQQEVREGKKTDW